MKRLLSLVFVFCLAAGTSLAQMLPQQQQQGASQQQQQPSTSIQMPQIGSSMFTSSSEFFRNLQSQGMLIQPPPYDRSVDTNSYVLGPGDIVNIGVWGPTPISYNISVTPEGSIIIPTFGVVRIGGMTLAEAKAYVRQDLSKQFKSGAITLTLIYPRSFYVIVSGRVRNPGRYTVTSFDRVDRAFELANLPRSANDTTTVFPNFSLRRIELVHRDGSVQNVDLLKFYMTGNLSDDPYLRAGDAIVVPGENLAAGSISISGAVKMPGNFEYVPGDRLKDLLELSGGLTGLADSAHARILSWNGSKYDEQTVNMEDTTVLDQPLAVNSRVVVPTDWSKINDYYVCVGGQVKSPGIYPISVDSTKLSTIINLAGGFTQWASLPKAVIYRKTAQAYSRQAIMLDTLSYIFRATGVSQEQLQNFSQELLMRPSTEVVSTNFVKLFADKDEKYDCTLRSGDSIYVPRNTYSVYVYGQVKYPGYIQYHNGWGYKDYIEAAGGPAEDAKTGDTKVIKGVTYQWYSAGDTRIEPGDFVYVPKPTIKPQLYSWNLFKDVITTIGAVASIATTIVLVIRTSQGK
ncbi:MAG: SLBB domain-containing protein [Bacteroidetes bacterium]|nr:SLBB domain-containing protein [Bacteroidota bacterium]